MSPKLPRMMIFIPFEREAAAALRSDGRIEDQLIGWAATAQMMTAHGYRTDEREDADYAALLYASIVGMIRSADDRRLVVAAEVPIARVSDHTGEAEFGAVGVRDLDWADVTAVFVDEPEAAHAVTAARKAILTAAESSMAALVDLPAVTELTDNHELLWHTPDEAW